METGLVREKQVARNFNEIARDIFRNNDDHAKFRRLEVLDLRCRVRRGEGWSYVDAIIFKGKYNLLERIVVFLKL